MWTALLDWFDSRTGYRALGAHALGEPLPPGTGWTFTTGSVVALLIGVQFVTGVGLATYYVPSPALAYDSLRFLITQVCLGWLLRALHVWGASFVVVAALAAPHPRVLVGSLQGTARGHLADRRGDAAVDPGLLLERLSAAVGLEGVLGHHRDDQRRRSSASDWPTSCAADTSWGR